MWSPEKPQIVPPGWRSKIAHPVAYDKPWTPLIIRTATGVELAVAGDSGLVRVGVLGGRELAVLLEKGVIAVPGVFGNETSISDDWGKFTPLFLGNELATADEYGGLGAWSRMESAVSTDFGLVIPGALAGNELSVSDDFGTFSAVFTGEDSGVAEDYGQGVFYYPSISDAAPTATSNVAIPPGCRYIDIILLGGGGGGAGGSQGAPGWDGNGGKSGSYNAYRWDRGPGRNTWAQLEFYIGVGGSGGARKSGTGGNGGTTSVVITGTSETLTAAGGAGGSGTSLGGGVSGAQNGKAPGNYTFQGKTASGGGENGGVPGAGGKGGGGSVWPTNPGSGSDGARGQAWIRFSG